MSRREARAAKIAAAIDHRGGDRLHGAVPERVPAGPRPAGEHHRRRAARPDEQDDAEVERQRTALGGSGQLHREPVHPAITRS